MCGSYEQRKQNLVHTRKGPCGQCTALGLRPCGRARPVSDGLSNWPADGVGSGAEAVVWQDELGWWRCGAWPQVGEFRAGATDAWAGAAEVAGNSGGGCA